MAVNLPQLRAIHANVGRGAVVHPPSIEPLRTPVVAMPQPAPNALTPGLGAPAEDAIKNRVLEIVARRGRLKLPRPPAIAR